MIKNWFVTGDTHGQTLQRLQYLKKIENIKPPEETALIILGDAGFNFYLNKSDQKNKKHCQDTGYIIYCVRGNHEERPGKIEGMETFYDDEVAGIVYREPQFPNIRYFIDGCEYKIGNYTALVLGGAYSVDKFYRLEQAKNRKDGWSGWFEGEQLTEREMEIISNNIAGRNFDFVLSHTCPFQWMPTDLFLPQLDQSTVDNSMEKWLEYIRDYIGWRFWLFGHFHDDRLVRPCVEMYYKDIENLEDIVKRWDKSELDWWLKKDPNYYMEER